MRLPAIVTRKDLERVYGSTTQEFVPTHLVRISSPNSKDLLRLDYVRLLETDERGLRFGKIPSEENPTYVVLSTGKWQSFDFHGIIHDEVVRYLPNYEPPSSCRGFVYFVQAGEGGPIKIGWSQDVSRRMAELQTANAHPLDLLGVIRGRLRDESAVHVRFAHLRMEGEWFRNSPELHEFLKGSR